MSPLGKFIDIVRSEHTAKVVKHGSQAFGAVRNVAAIGAAAASLLTGGLFVTQQRGAVDSVTPPAATPAPLIAQLRGKLAYEAAFLQDLGTPPPLSSGSRPTSEVRPRADGVDIVPPPGVTLPTVDRAPLIFRRAVPARYLVEIELVVQPGTDGVFQLVLRQAGPLTHTLRLDTGNELINIQHVDNSAVPQRSTSLIPNAIPASGLQRGRPLHLAAAIDGSHYRVFVEGELAADIHDPRVNVPDSATATLGLSSAVARGQLTISALRVYALADIAGPQSLLTQVKGPLIYEPSLARDLGTPPPQASGARPTARVQVRGDAVDLLAGGDYAPIWLTRAIPARYLAEFDVAVQPATDGSLSWTLRGSSAPARRVALAVDAANELIRVTYIDASVTPNVTVSLVPSAVNLPAFQKGRVVHIAVAVIDSRYLVFVDGEVVMDVVESRVAPPSSGTFTISAGASLSKGGYAVSQLRFYDAREPASAPAPPSATPAPTPSATTAPPSQPPASVRPAPSPSASARPSTSPRP